MKVLENVRGSMVEVPSLELGVDTVYMRSNVIRIDEEEFNGWQYDEIQMTTDEYIEKIAKEKDMLQDAVDMIILSSL